MRTRLAGLSCCLLFGGGACAEPDASIAPSPLNALVEICAGEQPFGLDGFTSISSEAWIDLPDTDTVRATSTIERWFSDRMINREIGAPLLKGYCQTGVSRLVVDYQHPVEDDAISAIVYRSIYRWNSEADPVGWQIESFGERPLCARGKVEGGSRCQ